MRRIVFLVVMALVISWMTHIPNVFAQTLFIRNLRVGNRGEDVRQLQKYLNSIGIPVARIGAGSLGQETAYYGEATRAAVIRFQELYAVQILHPLRMTTGTGNFFGNTRAFVNELTRKVPLAQLHVPQTSQPVYRIGGEVTGLHAPVIVRNNTADALRVQPGDTANFWFSKMMTSGEQYDITVSSQEGSRQYCYVSSNGRGIVTSYDVSDIRVMCSLNPLSDPFLVRSGGGGGGGGDSGPVSRATYTVGGVVSNLSGTLILQNNHGDDLELNGSGSFTFPTSLENGSSYSVTVRSHPSSPTQVCDVSDGSGSIHGASVSSISITCRTIPTISLNAISKTYGDDPFSVTATSTSDGTITYSSSDESVASVSGSTVTIVGAGTATITGSQATSTLYAATSTRAVLTVARATPVIASLSSISVNSAQYSGICFEDFDVLTYCTLETPLRIDLPTSTSNGEFTSLTASNADVIASSTEAVSHLLGYPVIDAVFSLPLEFSAYTLLSSGPFTTVATLHQATTTNYTAGSVSFGVTVELTNLDPDGNSCFNHGVMLRTPYDTYECACPSTFTGQYCQTIIH